MGSEAVTPAPESPYVPLLSLEDSVARERARCLAIVRAHDNTDPERAIAAIAAAIEGGR